MSSAAKQLLYFLAKVARGLDAADRGDVLPHDKIERVPRRRVTRVVWTRPARDDLREIRAPTTVCGTPLNTIERPTTPGSAPK